MFTRRLKQSIAGAALAAGTLGMAALVGAGTASATATDDTFLENVHQVHISVDNPTQVIKVGKSVCAAFDAGDSKDQILAALLKKNDLSETQGKAFIVYSVKAYCPQYYHGS